MFSVGLQQPALRQAALPPSAPRARAATIARSSRPVVAGTGRQHSRRMAGSGGAAPRRRGQDAERLPLFVDSPTGMGTLKHRAGGSLGDILTAGAYADAERGDRGGSPPAAQGGLSPTVLLCVAVASMGALCFGYHLGVVNGPLEELALQLGFGGNAFLQGLVGLAAVLLPLCLPRLQLGQQRGSVLCFAGLATAAP